MRAKIDNMNREFCHAVTMDEQRDRVFVHQSECNFRIDESQIGDIIEIGSLSEDRKGSRGHEISWVERPSANFTEGSIVILDEARGFAFIRPDGSRARGIAKSPDDVLVHITGFADFQDGDSATFRALSRTDRVRGVVRETSRGLRASQVEMVQE